MSPQARFQATPEYHFGISLLRTQNVDFAWGIVMPSQKAQYTQQDAPVVVTLGKGEVVSSILTRGTSLNALMQKRKARRAPISAPPQTLQKLAKHDANAPRLPWTSRGVRSAHVGRAFSDPTAPSRAVKKEKGRPFGAALKSRRKTKKKSVA